MLRPSAAPRWKTTTRRFLGAAAVCAITVRTRKFGIAVVPARARAPLWRKKRRLICMRESLLIGVGTLANLRANLRATDPVFQSGTLAAGDSAAASRQQALRLLACRRCGACRLASPCQARRVGPVQTVR